MANILITGGTGFVGSHLVEYLLSKNISKDIIHVTTFGNQKTFVHSLLPIENIHALDLTDQTATDEIISKIEPHQIYHLAATAAVGSSFDQAKKTLQNNMDIQLSLLNSIKKHIPESRTLAIGSALEYDVSSEQPIDENTNLAPISPYAVSKVMQDMLAISYFHLHKLDIVRVRPFNHFGERQTPGFVLADFAKQIAQIEQGKQEEISVGNLAAIRDFTDVKDVVKAYFLLMNKGNSGEVYNVGSGQGTSITQLLDWLIEASTSDIKITIDQDRFRPIDIKSIIADNTKMKSLGWNTEINIKDTLIRTLNWWRKNI